MRRSGRWWSAAGVQLLLQSAGHDPSCRQGTPTASHLQRNRLDDPEQSPRREARANCSTAQPLRFTLIDASGRRTEPRALSHVWRCGMGSSLMNCSHSSRVPVTAAVRRTVCRSACSRRFISPWLSGCVASMRSTDFGRPASGLVDRPRPVPDGRASVVVRPWRAPSASCSADVHAGAFAHTAQNVSGAAAKSRRTSDGRKVLRGGG